MVTAERPEVVLRLKLRGGNLELYNARDPEVLAEGPAGTGKTRTALELINDLVSGRVDENGNEIAAPAQQMTFYTQDTFTDLCRGPHVANTREVGRIRVTGYESKGRINKRIRIALEDA